MPAAHSRLGLALALLVAGLAPVAAATSNSDHTVVTSGTIEGPGWITLAFNDDGHAQATIELHSWDLPVSFGFVLANGKGDPQWMYGLTYSKEDRTRVEVNAGEIEYEVTEERGDLWGSAALRFHWTWHRTGDYRLAMWTAGDDIYRTNWQLGAGSDATLSTEYNGTDTFMYEGEDLEGPLEVQTADDGPSLRAQVAASQTIDVENNLLAIFEHGDNGTDRMEAHTPYGDYVCPCYYGELGPWAWGPGDYTFETTGYAVGHDERWIVLHGADVIVPSP